MGVGWWGRSGRVRLDPVKGDVGWVDEYPLMVKTDQGTYKKNCQETRHTVS